MSTSINVLNNVITSGDTQIYTNFTNSYSQNGNSIVGTGYTLTYFPVAYKLVGSGYSGTHPRQGGVNNFFPIGSPNYVGNPISLTNNILAESGWGDNNSNGATWIFTKNGNQWIQNAKLIGSGYTSNSNVTQSAVSLSSDGTTLAIGGSLDNIQLGSTWIFINTGSGSSVAFNQLGNKLIGSSLITSQGSSVALSSDGSTLAIGNVDAGSGGQNIGSTYIFIRTGSIGSNYVQQAELVGSGYSGNPNQGASISLSADGNTLAVGGPFDIDPTHSFYLGATWIFTRSGTTWSQLGNKLIGSGYSPSGLDLFKVNLFH